MLTGLELKFSCWEKHLQKQIIVAKTRSFVFEHEGTLALLGRTLPAESTSQAPACLVPGLCLMVLVIRPNVVHYSVVNHSSESIGLMPPYDASDIATSISRRRLGRYSSMGIFYLIVGNFAYTYSLYQVV